MNDQQWSSMKRILNEERAVTREVAEARPYVRYERGDLATVYADGRWSSIPAPQRRTVFTVAANLDDGIIITKHPVPGEPPVLPQMRPDHPVRKPMPKDRRGHDHADYGPKVRQLHVDGASHRRPHLERGEHVHGKHCHITDGQAKYLLSPKGYVDIRYEHAHTDKTSSGHLTREHGGQSQDGDHHHFKRIKDPHVSPEKRLDLHPLSLAKLRDADRVFFSIEGSVKADALLSAGECAFAVPSVTMWTAPELERFAGEHLSGKQVFVVPDADWVRNPLVACQAFLCADFLAQRGVRAAVASSPERKGIDDHLAAGGTVDEMLVQERFMSAGFNRWAREIRQSSEVRQLIRDKRGRERLIDVVRLLAMLATNEGQVVRPGRSLCQYVDFSHDRLRAEVNLVADREDGSVPPWEEWDFSGPDDWNAIYGPLARPFSLIGKLELGWWTPTPVFELRPDLRAETRQSTLASSPP